MCAATAAQELDGHNPATPLDRPVRPSTVWALRRRRRACHGPHVVALRLAFTPEAIRNAGCGACPCGDAACRIAGIRADWSAPPCGAAGASAHASISHQHV